MFSPNQFYFLNYNFYFIKTANIPLYGILRCLSKIDYYTEMLKIHVFSRFTIKTPRFVDVLTTLGL